MSLTFPVPAAQLGDLIPLERVQWFLSTQEEFSGLGSSEFISSELGPQYWVGIVSSVPIPNDEFRRLRARLHSLRGSHHNLLISDPLSKFPAADPSGLVIAGSTVQVNSVATSRYAIRLKGLPSGYVLTPGDQFSVVFDTSRRVLLETAEGATADSSGVTPEFAVSPAVPLLVGANAAVALVSPAPKVKIRPGTLSMESDGAWHSRINFEVVATLSKDG